MFGNFFWFRSSVKTAGIALAIALAIGLLQACSASHSNSSVDAMFQNWDRPDSPGCATVSMYKGQIVHSGTYGMASLEFAIPISASTRFHVASVSKQFTAAAVLLLVDDGLLSLDAEINPLLPELPDFGSPITIQQLIHHTSGIRDQWEILSLSGWRYSQDLITDADVLSMLAIQSNLNFSPGSEHLYSNTGYTLLAMIVSQVSGMSFPDFVQRRLFEPLGMDNSFFRDDFQSVNEQVATGYIADQSNGTFRSSVTNFDTVGATSLITTPRDLLLWISNFDNPDATMRSTFTQLQKKGVLNNLKPLAYGYGLNHSTYRGSRVISHDGADAGYRSSFVYFPDHQFASVITCNTPANVSELSSQMTDLIIGDKLDRKVTRQISSIQLAEAELQPFTGQYWNEQRHEYVVFDIKEGTLLISRNGIAYPLQPMTNTTFVLQPIGLEFEFDPDNESMTANPGTPSAVEYAKLAIWSPSQETLTGYHGTFVSAELPLPFGVSSSDRELLVSWLKYPNVAFTPMKPDVFVSFSGALHFTRDANDTVTGFRLETRRTRNLAFERRNP